MTLTSKQIYETVRTHLLKQGKRAMKNPAQKTVSGIQCLYRAPDGSKCAVGCLIPDTDYTEDQEGQGVRDLADEHLLPDYLVPHVELLVALQRLHDMCPVEEWERQLDQLAAFWGFDGGDRIEALRAQLGADYTTVEDGRLYSSVRFSPGSLHNAFRNVSVKVGATDQKSVELVLRGIVS